jgi:hypothetical protein
METPGTLRRMVGTVPRQRFEGWSKRGRIMSLKDLYINQRDYRVYVLTAVVCDIVEGEVETGFMFCCCSRVLMTSRGCKRTQETNPLKLPAIRSDVGIARRMGRDCLLLRMSERQSPLQIQGASIAPFPMRAAWSFG